MMVQRTTLRSQQIRFATEEPTDPRSNQEPMIRPRTTDQNNLRSQLFPEEQPEEPTDPIVEPSEEDFMDVYQIAANTLRDFNGIYIPEGTYAISEFEDKYGEVVPDIWVVRDTCPLAIQPIYIMTQTIQL